MKPWKIQKFFGDVVYDLRSRGLLPVAVLLLVGIVAVPLFLTSKGSDPAPAPAAAESAAELAPENQVAVLAYDPGVRDYKERLGELQAKDPFVQQFAGADAAATALSQSVPETAEVTGTSDPTTGGSTDVVSGGKTGGGKKKSGGTTKYFWYETDVRVGEAGAEERKNKVDAFSFLPSEAAPVLVFLGASNDGKRGVFLVAADVTFMEGDGDCFPSPDSCQLLALEPGQSRSLVYGVDSKTYTVKVIKIKRVVSSKPPN
jgi:hypothetical protein